MFNVVVGEHLKLRAVRLLFIVALSSLVHVNPVQARNIIGKVVSVADGDTITVLQNQTQYKIRLYGIDCPENGQDFGRKAKKFTASLTFGKTAKVIPYDTDKYGRTVGVVLVNGVNVNEQILLNGYAWQYRKYCKAPFCRDWLNLESKAKLNQVGIWSHYNPISPWDYRKNKRASKSSSSIAVKGNYHGNRRSHVFHSPRCQHYNCKNCTRSFQTREEAIQAGFRPCGRCKP